MAFLKKIKQAIGVGDTTVDAEFDLLAQDFKETYARLKQLGKYVVAYQAGIKELGEASVGMAPMILEQYEGSDRMYQVANQYKDHVGPHVVELAKSMDVYYAEDFHRPLTQYLAQYKTLEERITERNNRLKEMDRCVNEHQSLQGKAEVDPTRVQIAKEKAEYKSRAYKDLNDELKRDIPKLLEGRTFFLDALFAVFVYGQVNYMQNAAGALQAFYPHFQGINVDAAHNWPFVITDPAKSTIHPEIAARGFTPGASHAQAPAPVPARPAPSVPGPARVTARALYPFQGQDQSELSFQANDVIVVLRQGGDWWEGESHGRRGLFPGNYVALN